MLGFFINMFPWTLIQYCLMSFIPCFGSLFPLCLLYFWTLNISVHSDLLVSDFFPPKANYKGLIRLQNSQINDQLNFVGSWDHKCLTQLRKVDSWHYRKFSHSFITVFLFIKNWNYFCVKTSRQLLNSYLWLWLLFCWYYKAILFFRIAIGLVR